MNTRSTMTTLLDRRPRHGGRVIEVASSPATWPGRALQATWLATVGLGVLLELLGPEHPDPPAAAQPALAALGFGTLAVTAGVLRRRRWALQLSAALALPLVGLAVWCFAADAGGHWVAESVLASTVLVTSLHPGSWRMHRR
jgi:hypothetical protein